MNQFESRKHWEIILLATKMIETVLYNPWEPDPLKRIWKIAREVGYEQICLQ